MGQTRIFIEYLMDKAQSIPDIVYEKARDCLCDYLAVAEAGAYANKERWMNYLEHTGSGVAPVIGYGITTDCKTAALINGFNAHCLELDDGQRFAMIHLGGSIISALISVGAENYIDKKDLLKGIVVGYEAACRLSIGIQPSHKKSGFHTAGTCGTVGAAIAVATALKMSKRQLETVVSAAVTSAAGMLEIQEQASELKPYNIGRAAMDGLTAAYMGFTDFCGPNDILNGERGFIKLFSRECNPEKMVEMTDYYEIERIYVKPYAACRHCHSAIEAALKIRKRIDIGAKVDISKIDKVEVQTYYLAMKGHDHTEITGTSSAKLSMPYGVAAALVLGKADVSAFEQQNRTRRDILELTKKVVVIENPEFTEQSSRKRIAKVIVYLKDKGISEQIDFAKGDPENPMSRQEIIEKVYLLIGKKAKEIVDYVYT